MSSEARWPVSERFAWTEHDGPGRPPGAPRPLVVAVLAFALLAAGIGMLTTDTLCAEHRVLVEVLGAVVLLGSLACGLALLMNRPMAPVLALAPAISGVMIGGIDTLHDLTRGGLISVAFGIAAAVAAVLSFQSMRMASWSRRVARELEPLPVAGGAARPPVGEAGDVPDSTASQAGEDSVRRSVDSRDDVRHDIFPS